MEETKKSYYAIIPASVRYDTNLTPNAKLLYGELTALSNEKGYCWAGNEYFANLYEVNKDAISKWVAQLKKYGYIGTELIYKKDSKQISKRHIYILDPIMKNHYTYNENSLDPIMKIHSDNITINNKINIIKTNSVSPILDFWNSLENIRKHKNPNSDIYQRAVKYIDQLKSATFHKKNKLSDSLFKDHNVPQEALTKKFTDDEIKATIENMSLMYIGGYWPEDKKRLPSDLAGLIYSYKSGFSFFLRCFYNPVKPAGNEIKIKSLNPEVYNIYKEFAKDMLAGDQRREQKLIIFVNDLIEEQGKIFDVIEELYEYTSFKAHFGTSEKPIRFFNQHISYLKKQSPEYVKLTSLKTTSAHWEGFVKDAKNVHGYNFYPDEKEIQNMNVSRDNAVLRRKNQKMQEDKKREEEID